MMGKMGRESFFKINGSSFSLPLNMVLVCISFQSIGYLSNLCDDPLSWVMSLLWVFQNNAFSTIALCVCPIQSCYQVFFSCRLMFKGNLKKFYLCIPHSLCVSIFESVLWLLHSHHSKTMFQVSCRRCGTHHGPPSTRLFPSTSAHHPGNSLRNKNLVPWDLSALMTDSLALDIGSHHWPLIDRIYWVFDIRKSIHTH